MSGSRSLGVTKMLPKNVMMIREFERQSRARIQNEAENARLLGRNSSKETLKFRFPVWEITLRKFRMIRMRLNPAN